MGRDASRREYRTCSVVPFNNRTTATWSSVLAIGTVDGLTSYLERLLVILLDRPVLPGRPEELDAV
jgi:hypothetical protein